MPRYLALCGKVESCRDNGSEGEESPFMGVRMERWEGVPQALGEDAVTPKGPCCCQLTRSSPKKRPAASPRHQVAMAIIG